MQKLANKLVIVSSIILAILLLSPIGVASAHFAATIVYIASLVFYFMAERNATQQTVPSALFEGMKSDIEKMRGELSNIQLANGFKILKGNNQ